MTDMSRTPARARFSVRGMGVADSVSTSTSRRSCLSRSFAATPNRCSSSTTTSPRSRNTTSFESSRCVPITRSIDAVLEARHGPLLLGRADEPRQQPDLDRERREPLRERREVLRREDRRRDEDRDLLAVLDRLERRSQGDLGLAVADVADDEPVHRPAASMSALTSTTARSLVGRLLVGEARLHLLLPRRVRRVGDALDARPGRVELEQLVGEVRDGLLDALLRPQPLGPAELREVRVLGAAVARDPVDLLDRNEDLVGAGEAQLEVVAVLALGPIAATEHLLVAGDAVVDVDDEVARRQPLEDVPRHDATERLGPPDADGAEELAVGHEDEAVRATLEAAVQAAFDERHRAGRRCLGGVGDRDRMAALVQELGEARRLVGGKDDPGALALPVVDRGPRSPRRDPSGAPARASRTRPRS